MRSSSRCLSWLFRHSQLSTEGRSSIKAKVALESTIITHGMPYPENLKVAKSLEAIVREQGCTPATIALLQGNIKVGLNESELEMLASPDLDGRKISCRDLAVAITDKWSGGTTVSATMACANAFGIEVFATGGIGGVHRDFEKSLDISSDLTELAQTPVAVVSAGVKSILDINRTLEYLETQSVPVLAFADSNDFPGFFAPRTGCKIQYHTTDVNRMAKMIAQCLESQKKGVLIGVPIPSKYAELGQQIDAAILHALDECSGQNITGQSITPYVLRRVNEITHGASLTANIALIKNNVRVASQLALALHSQRQKMNFTTRVAKMSPDDFVITVIGGSIVDFNIEINADSQFALNGGTLNGEVRQSCGGVGRNHADALSRLGLPVNFISVVGNDKLADYVFHSCSHVKNVNGVKKSASTNTASYSSICHKGSVLFGVSNAETVFHQMTPDWIKQHEQSITKAQMVLVDGNLSVDTIRTIIDIANANEIAVWFDPADLSKMEKLITAGCLHLVDTISPNLNEFKFLASLFNAKLDFDMVVQPENFVQQIIESKMAQLLLLPKQNDINNLKRIILTMGENGVICLTRHKNGKSIESYYIEAPISRGDPSVKIVSGAGDCFNAAFIKAYYSKKMDTIASMTFATKCAKQSLLSFDAVPKSLENMI